MSAYLQNLKISANLMQMFSLPYLQIRDCSSTTIVAILSCKVFSNAKAA